MRGSTGEFIASGSEHMTVSPRAILAYLQLVPSNHEDWKDVQPRSGTEECCECRRTDDIVRSRIEDRRVIQNACAVARQQSTCTVKARVRPWRI